MILKRTYFHLLCFEKRTFLKQSSNKIFPTEDIPIKILKNSTQKKLTNIFNEYLINGKFPDILKRADVNSIFQKGNNNEMENYCPVSMFSTFSKLFGKLLFEQINDHIQSKLSKHLTGFHKNHSTQNALLVMIEKWKIILNKNLKVGAPFMDLSKVIDTLDHSLIVGKIKCIWF